MTRTPVDSITIPDRFLSLCNDWHSGQNCMLYAVSSSGGLYLGSVEPYNLDGDSDDGSDASREERWYYRLWIELSADINRALLSVSMSDWKEWGQDAYGTIAEFDSWVDGIIDKLCAEYGLEDYEW